MVCFFFVLDLFLDLFEFKKFRFYLLVIIEEMSTFLGMLLNKKRKKKIGHFMMEKFLIFTWQNSHYVDFSMAFKQSFKYLKNEKINFIKVILKLECLFDHYIYILFHLILYS